jgi:ABC-type sugar transport system, permease component
MGEIALKIYVFVISGMEFIYGYFHSLILQIMRPLPGGYNLVILQEIQYQWPEMMAVATNCKHYQILLMFLFLQRYFVSGGNCWCSEKLTID